MGLIPSDTNNQENGQLPPPSIFFVKDTPQEVPLGSAKQQDGEDIPLGFHQKNLQPQPDSKPDSVDINIAGWHLTTVSFKNGVKFLTTLTINNWGNIQ